MPTDDRLPFDAPRALYEAQADALHAALLAGDEAAAWKFKWEHPAFRGKGVDEVRAAVAAGTLTPDDARQVIARIHHLDDWAQLVRFAESAREDEDVITFERAVEMIVAGEFDALRLLLAEHPALVRARSARRHGATLLHYIAANGVEGYRQRTPPNIEEIATLLLDAGSDPDAVADMYDHQCTTMSMLASSSPPAAAGKQLALAGLLVDRGAPWVGAGTKWRSAVRTALTFGFPALAEYLVSRGAPVEGIDVAAGIGRLDEVTRLYPEASGEERHAALALAAMLGRTEVVRFLLASGEDPNRLNPDGYHAHSTPLHQAVWAGHLETARALIDAGARLDIADTLFGGTPLGWAKHHGDRAELVQLLERGGR